MALLLEKGKQVDYVIDDTKTSSIHEPNQDLPQMPNNYRSRGQYVEVRAEYLPYTNKLPVSPDQQIPMFGQSVSLSFFGDIKRMQKDPKSVDSDPFLELQDNALGVTIELFIKSFSSNKSMLTLHANKYSPVCVFDYNKHLGSRLSVFGKEIYEKNQYSPFISQESINEFSDIVDLLAWIRANPQYLSNTS